MSSLHFSVLGQSLRPTRFVARARQFEVVIDEPLPTPISIRLSLSNRVYPN